MKIAGYRAHIAPGEYSGEPGTVYNYIMAGNGLFIESESEYLQARIQISETRIRGLASLQERVVLTHGRIPAYLFGSALGFMGEDLTTELYVAVVWRGRYSLDIPSQDAGGAHVKYTRPPATVLDLHSHPTFAARFSGTDNADEVGFQLYGVVGMIHTLAPQYTFRVGIYGHFKELMLQEVFAL